MNNNSKIYKIILSGGGTGGHIYPAIAIADELKSRFPNSEFLFVGAKDKMEMEKIPNAGYKIKGLWIAGLQRQLTLKNLMFPFKLIHSLIKSISIINTFKPDIAIGTGGFASGALLQIANLKHITTVVQEQNSYPGITNKLLGKKAAKICVAYNGLERFFPKEKLIKTGNPVRENLVNNNYNSAKAKAFFKLNETKKTILVIGGSLGAKRINELIEAHIDVFKTLDTQVIWQCGKLYYERFKIYDDNCIKVHQYINNMNAAYAAADVIISRAGASSVSELCIAAKPVIFIPSPNVAEDHQTKNASAIASQNAAILIKENELDNRFKAEFTALITSQKQQNELSKNIKQLALPNATKHIVDEIVKLLIK